MVFQNTFTRLYCMCYAFAFVKNKFTEKMLQTYNTYHDHISVPYFNEKMRYTAAMQNIKQKAKV